MSNVVYKIENILNGKRYIGRTKDFERRMTQHEYANGQNPLLHNAINKYSWNCFSKEIVHKDIPDEFVRFMEDTYISYFNSLHPYGYNLRYNYSPEDGFSVPEMVGSVSESVIPFVIYSIRKYNLYDHDRIYLMVFNELVKKGYDTSDISPTIDAVAKLLDSMQES